MQDAYSKTLFQSKKPKWETGKESIHYYLSSIFNVENWKIMIPGQQKLSIVFFFGPSNRNILKA